MTDDELLAFQRAKHGNPCWLLRSTSQYDL
jgi:hypothetical protein